MTYLNISSVPALLSSRGAIFNFAISFKNVVLLIKYSLLAIIMDCLQFSVKTFVTTTFALNKLNKQFNYSLEKLLVLIFYCDENVHTVHQVTKGL